LSYSVRLRINDFLTDAVETQELPSTTEFRWRLRVSSADYSIVGWAFKVSGAPARQIEPLERKKPDADGDSIVFEAPKCRKGDKLIAIVRVSWEKQLTPVNFLSTFRSTVE